MQKRREIFIVVGLILITTFFSLIIYYSNPHTITGFTIFSSQPNVTDGKDTYLWELSSSNYYDATELRLGSIAIGGGREFRSILYFNLSSIPSENTVISADLSIYISSSSNNNNISSETSSYPLSAISVWYSSIVSSSS